MIRTSVGRGGQHEVDFFAQLHDDTLSSHSHCKDSEEAASTTTVATDMSVNVVGIEEELLHTTGTT
jgi:hypothetical protein